MAKSETKQYLIERGKEVLRVTVPATWKVTFGPMVPGSNRGRGFHVDDGFGQGACLRFYESKENQRAVFTHVTGFRDLSIRVERRVATVETKKQSKAGPNKYEASESETTDEKFVEEF